jgi:hypothetical protein
MTVLFTRQIQVYFVAYGRDPEPDVEAVLVVLNVNKSLVEVYYTFSENRFMGFLVFSLGLDYFQSLFSQTLL